MNPAAITYFLAVGFWVFTALYGVLASQAFIQEQFLAPRLFDPLAGFADWHAIISVVLLALWGAARIWRSIQPPSTWTWAIAIFWLAITALLTTAAPVSAPHTTTSALATAGLGVFVILVLAAAELGSLRQADDGPSRDRSRADLVACLLVAAGVTIIYAGAAAWLDGLSAAPVADFLQALRLNCLVAAAAFLALSAVRGAAARFSRRVMAEAVLSAAALGVVLSVFVSTTFLSSISIGGFRAVAIGLGLGVALAFAIAARGSAADVPDDGVVRAFSALSPGVTARWWGFALWLACLLALAVAVGAASHTADWSFLLLRTGVALIWLLALSAALALSRRFSDGGARTSFAFVVLILGVHIALQAGVTPVHASSLRNPSGRWLAEILEGDVRTEGVGDLVRFLHAQTNIPRDTQVEAVDVDLAQFTGSPAAQRPHVFLFVVDSLRRDYLSPYNPAVTFTPAIAALAQDSLVFRNAFTQYGATGLSVPALWVGGSILHKQYVSSFPRMNALAKLLAHEQYGEWIGMEH